MPGISQPRPPGPPSSHAGKQRRKQKKSGARHMRKPTNSNRKWKKPAGGLNNNPARPRNRKRQRLHRPAMKPRKSSARH